ncbi:MAG: CBS domain-containing protein [Ignavibacteria bacterium]|nr:MAG: CBS domain-containing protein [Ignavibacteria bacterium]
MKLVKHILEKKGNQIYSVSPDDTMYDALKLMADKGIGALVVMKGEALIGIVSERDYARKVILKGKTSKETKVSEIMTDTVICVSPETGVEECMAVLSEKRIRHLPVEEKGKLVGVISIGDIVKAVIEEKKFEIDQLISYIQGDYK